MKITVVTVCYNCEDTIEKTIDSVLGQDYEDMEYLIIDGASGDDTLKKANAALERNTHVAVRVLSEPDKGLYDAMNKAMDMATGEYVIYMNSGDVFAAPDALLKAAEYLKDRPMLAYGDVIRLKPGGEVYETYGGRRQVMSLLLQGKMMCHQSILTRTDVLREYRFNLDYTITADYDLVMRIVHDKCSLQHIPVTISRVENTVGISSTVANMDEMRRQDDISLKANFPLQYALVTPPKAVVRSIRRISERKK